VEIIIGGRRTGKTTKALEWLAQAERIDTYPFWSRVLLVHSTDYAQDLRIRLRQEAESRGEDDYALSYNKVYSWEEWATVHLGIQPVEVLVDNADFLLNQFLSQFKGMVKGYTFSINDQPYFPGEAPPDTLTVLGPPPKKMPLEAVNWNDEKR
jgi:hypothetical protein